MPVYVDSGKYPYRNMLMCHMFADTLKELHEMADKIGINRKWFQDKKILPHYDICQSKKKLAIQNGAEAVCMKTTAKYMEIWECIRKS